MNSGYFKAMRLDRLQEAMEAAGLDQPALAIKAGCTQGAISQILLGNTLRSRFLPDIASALGVSLQWLRGESEDRDPSAPLVPTSQDVMEHFDIAVVPELEIGYSMGGGSVLLDYEQRGVVPFRRAWLKNLMNGGIDDLFVARGEGDSMQPTLLDGDFVLVDTSQKQINKQDRIWCVSYGDLGMIKRVRKLPGDGYMIFSDNPSIAPLYTHDGEMFVIGRVIWIGRKM
jgi:phage repressor protein C with HTH and peptisase S24 domain